MNTIVAYLNHMQRMESQMAAEITRRYGEDIAARLRM
jgi:conjugative transfer pilus assembly protein TraH